MTWLRKEKRIETGTLGPNESYSVEVMVEVYWNPETQQEEDAFDGEASRKIEAAIEAVHPGWFHTCHESPKQHCRACAQKRFDKQNKRSYIVP